jgi:hypothetical protein
MGSNKEEHREVLTSARGGGLTHLLSSNPDPSLWLYIEREEHGAAGRGARRGPSLVAGSSMLERGGGGKAPWWPAAACLKEVEEGGREELIVTGRARSKWNERGAGRGTKYVKNL